MDKPIPLVDLAAQWAEIEDEAMPLVQARLRSGDYLGHDTIAAFEAEWAAYVGGGVHAVACSSGTDAVELTVRACTAEGAVVDVQERTFVATVAGVERAGRRIQRDALNSRWWSAPPERRPKQCADAAILTHLYGSTAGAAERAAEWRELGVVVIEDASQSHGNPDSGHIGDAAAFSLYPSKNLGGVGQGGVVVFRDHLAAAKARRMREHGYDRASDRHFSRGWNLRLDAFNADVLRVKLRRLPQHMTQRRKIASAYIDGLAGLSGVCAPSFDPKHAWHLFVIRLNEASSRDMVLERLRAKGIGAAIHYRRNAFGAEDGWNRDSISLPLYPQMTDSQVDRVVCAVRECVS